MDLFTAASHHDILVLLFEIALLLFFARLLGELAQRLNQPAVVGEILAGIILGPSVLSSLVPALGAWIVPQTEVQGYLLEVISLVGAIFLLLITGLETDLALVRRHARTAIGVSYGGIIATFTSGFLLGQYLPDFLLGDPSQRLVFSLFVATAMSISAIPVIAKVLMDLNLMRRDIGQTIIAAGMSDDTTGWILLSIVAGLAGGQAVTAGSVLSIVGSVLGFLVLSFTVGHWLVKRLLDYVQDEVISQDRLLTLVVVLTFTWGAMTQALNLEAVLGAFVMGVLFGQMPRLPDQVHHQLESIALGIFSPIFFAVAGLKVNLLNLLEPQLLLITLLVILIATMGKVIGTYFGARVIGGRDHWTALSFGAGLNARGAMEIIIATIGLSLGILSQDMFSIIVVMAMATSLMAPAALRYVLQNVEPEEQELERLRREEAAADSIVAQTHRVLLPVRRREIGESTVQTVEAKLLEQMGKQTDLSITLLNVSRKENAKAGNEFLTNIAPLFSGNEVLTKVVTSDDPSGVILEEIKKDYDLLILGASERHRDSSVLFSPLVDTLVRLAPTPTMVVHGPRQLEAWAPKRVLVPTNGTLAARHAAEVGFSLVDTDNDGAVLLLHVLEEEIGRYDYREIASREHAEQRREVGQQIVDDLASLAGTFGIKTETMVAEGRTPEDKILEVAQNQEMDLIILGTNVRPGSSRLYMGPRVEQILTRAGCPVVVLNSE
ncbi:MAG TPA: cation:proton antiporter [Candidatus Sulfomarinibacteraceae bacterium]|nr:cation:proton antiporter [Candidatus Sulfomarinibacteraceae bacterium]